MNDIDLYFHAIFVVSAITGIRVTRVAQKRPGGLSTVKAYAIGFFGGAIILIAGLLLCPLALFSK